MKRMFWLLLITLALPMAAFANSIGLTNSAGTLSGSSAGLNLSGSTLIAINGPDGMLTGDLGSLTFSTGTLTSGSLPMGGSFAAGGSFVITGSGTDGIPNGVIFNGSFWGPVTWSMMTLANGTHQYTLSAALSGTWFTGQSANGATVQLSFNTGKGFFNGSTTIASGDTDISGTGLRMVLTPEPASLTLFGTGLVGLAGMLRRQSKK